MRVAIIHYWMVNMRGGEAVLEALAELFPGADLYTHVVDRDGLSPLLRQMNIRTSFIARLPFAKRLYPLYLPLMPMALEQLDLRNYDLVISSESGPAKGVLVPPQALHLCYCHTPMRYLWDQRFEYLRGWSALMRLLSMPLFSYLRLWDRLSADRVDHFIASSWFVRARIRRAYRREAEVVYPPVNMARYRIAEGAEPGDYYLLLGQLVGYKRADLAVEAFNALGRRLLVVGEGPCSGALRRRAGRNIEFLGRQSDAAVAALLAGCRALVFPGVEDFGIVPLEAMASGRPVIAYAQGGALETVVDGVTGVFFDQPSADSLAAAVERFEAQQQAFEPAAIRRHAARFGRERFVDELEAVIERLSEGRFGRRKDAAPGASARWRILPRRTDRVTN